MRSTRLRGGALSPFGLLSSWEECLHQAKQSGGTKDSLLHCCPRSEWAVVVVGGSSPSLLCFAAADVELLPYK